MGHCFRCVAAGGADVRFPQTAAASPTEVSSAITPVEVALLALATAVGFALRAYHLGDSALTHFDEGVYAFTGFGLATPSEAVRLFPDQQKFSPPVYFSLVALANLLGSAPDRSPFVVNLLLGTLSVPVLWAFVRRWFGGVAAIAAVWLLAMSEFHIAMSRTALTDVTFALTFLVAIGAVLVAIERGTVWHAVLAGVAVGLAWNTKYHGWFALVVGAMVIGGRWQLQHAGVPWFRRALRSWLVMSVVAALCYAPWSFFIQGQPGSSAGWVSYFATMLRLDWLGNLWQQVAQQVYLEGPWSRASVPLSLVAADLVARARGRGTPVALVLASAVLAALIGSAGCALVLAVAALWRGWKGGLTGPLWLLGAVVVLWVIMAPIYHPYFRLILPFAIATYALGGAGLDGWMTSPPRRYGPLAGLVASAAVGGLTAWRADPSNPWRPTPGLAVVAQAIDAAIPPGAPVSVLGEPALAFYLHRRGHASFERTTLESLDSLTVARYLVTGVYLRRSASMRTNLEERRGRLETVGRYPVGIPSDLRLLDDFTPDSASQWIQSPDSTYDVLLYRLAPPQGRVR